MKMKLIVLTAAALLMSGCRPSDRDAADSARVAAADAVCKPTLGASTSTSCFVTLTASRNDRLVSVMSPMAREVQIHEMSMDGDVMRMRQLTEGLPLPAGEPVVLRPGGAHLMLIEVRGKLTATEGEVVPLALSFETAPPLAIEAHIGQPGGAPGHGAH